MKKRDEHNGDSVKKKGMMKKKNVKRLGGGGLSLETFANVKSNNNHYNPAVIKKKKEFYKNAKYVMKFRKSLKQESQLNGPSHIRPSQGDNKTEDDDIMNKKKNRHCKNNGAVSLEKLYEKKREEKEKERVEREASIQAKKEAKEKAEARRKSLREKIFKRTQKGQPVMKHRIEHLLETIQGSNKHLR